MAAEQPPASKPPEPAGDIGKARAPADDPPREREIYTDPAQELKFSDDLAFVEAFGDPSAMTPGMRIVTALVLFAVIAMVGYLVLLVLYPDQYGPEDWIGAGSFKPAGVEAPPMAELKGFELGGIHLGLPADEAFKVYPSMRFTPNPKGGRIGAYRHHEGQYRVFFHGLEKNGRAYRIESRHVFAKISYLELLTELSQRYGQPTGSECGTEQKTIAIECHLVWAYPTVGLSANIKTTVSEDDNRASTALSVTAIDIRPESIFAGPGKKNRSLGDIRRRK